MNILNRYGSALRIYDNGGKTADRFTIIPPRWATAHRTRGASTWEAIASSAEPFHPQGFGQHVTATPGPHLGARIHWDALPRDVQKFTRQAFPEFAPLGYDADTIARHFCIAAVWADCEEGTSPRITAKALATARAFAVAFIAAHESLSLAALACEGYGSHPDAGSPAAAFGHDLYLTAAGHGAGFWDRDELGDTGEALAEVIHTAPRRRWYIEADFYAGWLDLSAPNFDKGATA